MDNGFTKTKVLIAAKERDIKDQVRRILTTETDRVDISGTAADGLEAVQMAVQIRPDIVVLRENLPIYNGFQVSEMISLSCPDTKIVIISDRKPEIDSLGKAMQVGIREWVSYPFDTPALTQAILGLADLEAKKYTEEYATATDPKNLPRIIVITGGKGGVGKTTIATCLATYLATQYPDKVALVDFYTQFGDVALMMNMQPSRSIVDMAPMVDEIDKEIIEDHMVSHPIGLKVLFGSIRPEPLDAITPACAEKVLHILKSGYTHIVVDLPPVLHATTLYILGHAYKVVIVTTLFDLPSIHDSRQLYQTLNGTYVPSDQIILVANRGSKSNTIKPSDIQATFGRPVDVVLPNDNHLITSINRGEAFVSAYSHSPLSTSIAQLVTDYIEPGSELGDKGGSSYQSNNKHFRIFGRR